MYISIFVKQAKYTVESEVMVCRNILFLNVNISFIFLIKYLVKVIYITLAYNLLRECHARQIPEISECMI